jgi:apolipoprotein N-acyltransferase
LIGATLWVAALGALQTLSFTFTAALWWLPLLTTAALVARLDGAGPRQAAWLGWVYGTAWLGAGVWWLFVSMHRYGHLPAWMAAAGVALLSGALSLYLALACAAYARWRRGRAGFDAVLFGAVWLAAELARGVLFTGFPWIASGYSQIDGPLAALAPWVGTYGLGAALAALAALLARRGLARWAAVGAALAALALLGPRDFTASTGPLRVTLLQTNVPQDEKFRRERMPITLGWLQSMLFEARGDLIVAPETALPLLPSQLADFMPEWWSAVEAHFRTPGRAALIGLPLGDPARGYTNSVAGLSPAPAYRYDKFHLVPFGEFIPTGFRWFTEMMNIPLGDFDRGRLDAPSFVVGAQRVAPNICYEDLFGEELAVRFRDPAAAPTILVNLSNIGWFGDTVAIPQHLNISRARALELQRPMLRSTNTGATAIVDHRGRVLKQLSPFERGVLDGEVEGRSGQTPYAWWAGRFGLWPLALLAFAVLAAAAVSGRRAPASRAVRR